MAAYNPAQSYWRPRTLTDRRNDITTVKSKPSAAGFAPKDVSHQESAIVELMVTESEQITRRIQFSVATTPLPSWIVSTLTSGGKLLALPIDWDRNGAPRIEAAAIQIALDALCLVMDDKSSLPEWTPTRDGGVQLDWHENGIDLEISFDAGSSDGYAVFVDHEAKIPEWDGTVTSRLDSLRQILRERLR